MSRKQRSAPKNKYIYLTQTQLSPKVPLDYLKHARHQSDDKLIRREPSTSSKFARQQQEKQYSQVPLFKEEPPTKRYVTEAKQPKKEKSVDQRRIRTASSRENMPLKRDLPKATYSPTKQVETRRSMPSEAGDEPGIIINVNPNRQRSPYRYMGAIRETDESRCLSPEKHYVMRSSRESNQYLPCSPVKDATFRKIFSTPTKEDSTHNIVSILESEHQFASGQHPLLAKLAQYKQTSTSRLQSIRLKLCEMESILSKPRAIASC